MDYVQAMRQKINQKELRITNDHLVYEKLFDTIRKGFNTFTTF